jgi:hypothetical protein
MVIRTSLVTFLRFEGIFLGGNIRFRSETGVPAFFICSIKRIIRLSGLVSFKVTLSQVISIEPSLPTNFR